MRSEPPAAVRTRRRATLTAAAAALTLGLTMIGTSAAHAATSAPTETETESPAVEQPANFVVLEVPHVVFWLVNGEKWADYADVDGVRVWASAENMQQFEGYTATWVPADGNVHVYLVPDEGYSFHTTHVGGRQLYAGDVEVRDVQDDPTNPEPAQPVGPAIDEAAFTITIPDDDFDYFVGDTSLPAGPHTLGPIGAGAVTATVKEGFTAHPDAVLRWPFTFSASTGPVDPTPPAPAPTPSPEVTAPPAAVSAPSLTLSQSTIAAGGELTVNAEGFVAGEAIEIWLHSAPVRLVTGTIDTDGTLERTVTIPTGTEPGTHRVEVRGADSGSVYAELTVTTMQLAATGGSSDASVLLLAGGGAMALGAAAIIISARRRALPA